MCSLLLNIEVMNGETKIGIYDVAEVGAIYAENSRATQGPKVSIQIHSFVCTALYFRAVENLWFCLCNDFRVIKFSH